MDKSLRELMMETLRPDAWAYLRGSRHYKREQWISYLEGLNNSDFLEVYDEVRDAYNEACRNEYQPD